MHTVLISDKFHPAGLDILQSARELEVLYRPGLSGDDLLAAVATAHALIVRSATRVTREVIEAGRSLLLVARAGVGVDNIDVAAATRRGIVVANCPGGNTVSAAEHTISLMMAIARRIPQANSSVHQGRWERGGKFMGTELTGKTLGLVGLGRIGSEVAARATGLKMRVLAFDPFISQERAHQIKVSLVPLEQVLAESDFISLHVPRNEKTENLLDRGALLRMKNGAYLVNCARGGIVDEEALAELIAAGHLAGAAVDVFRQEPPTPENPLLKLENVIATPHLGAATQEAQEKVAVETALGVVEGLTSGRYPNAINLPDVSPAVMREIAPTLELIERLGSFVAQLVTGSVAHVEVLYGGQAADQPTRVLTRGLLKSILGHFLGEGVNYVNAPFLAEERMIRVTETRQSHAEDFTSLLQVTVGNGDEERTAVATLFGRREPKLVRLDGYDLEASLVGDLLVFSNYDQPGVIGHIGGLLGDHGINIAGMQLGRERQGGRAVAVVNVDSAIDAELLDRVRELPEIIDARFVRLGQR